MPKRVSQYSSSGERQMRSEREWGEVKCWQKSPKSDLQRMFWFPTAVSCFNSDSSCRYCGQFPVSSVTLLTSLHWGHSCVQLSALEPCLKPQKTACLKPQKTAQPFSKMVSLNLQGGAAGREFGCFFGKLPVTVSLGRLSWAANIP